MAASRRSLQRVQLGRPVCPTSWASSFYQEDTDADRGLWPKTKVHSAVQLPGLPCGDPGWVGDNIPLERRANQKQPPSRLNQLGGLTPDGVSARKVCFIRVRSVPEPDGGK